MVEVKFYDNVADELLKFAVIISKTDNMNITGTFTPLVRIEETIVPD